METESQRLAVEAFRLAHERAGGHSALARICGCTPGNIKQLIDRGSQLPSRFVLKTEAKTGVSRHDLRPDLYPREDPPAHPSAPNSSHGADGHSTEQRSGALEHAP